MVVRRLESLGLIIGPLLFALSPLFWIDGHYGVTGGLLIAIAAVPWVYGLIGEYNALRPRFPLLSGLWMLLVLIGMFGTVAFGLQGVFESVFGITEFRSLATFDIYPLPVAIVLILAGPLFPVALLSLGAMHWWTGLTPAGALCCWYLRRLRSRLRGYLDLSQLRSSLTSSCSQPSVWSPGLPGIEGTRNPYNLRLALNDAEL